MWRALGAKTTHACQRSEIVPLHNSIIARLQLSEQSSQQNLNTAGIAVAQAVASAFAIAVAAGVFAFKLMRELQEISEAGASLRTGAAEGAVSILRKLRVNERA